MNVLFYISLADVDNDTVIKFIGGEYTYTAKILKKLAPNIILAVTECDGDYKTGEKTIYAL